MSAVEMEEVDLNAKVAMVLSDLEVAIEEKNANVIVEPLPVVKGFRRQLQQLFQNLVSNALKYSKAGVSPEIRITASVVSGDQTLLKLPAEKKYHLVEVKDNGIGFDQEYAERIFQMFHRLHGRSEYSGTGIGLAIAKKVVENHRGFIWAEGKPGEGATFRVLLPV
jgi:signal transduction histidine kinase